MYVPFQVLMERLNIDISNFPLTNLSTELKTNQADQYTYSRKIMKKGIHSTPNSTWKMERTVTGSVAEIRAPNIRHSTNGSLYMRYITPPRYL